MKALEMLYRDKKWIEEECDISKITIERVQTMIKDLVEINEAIAELEALQQPKSCEGCKYFGTKKECEHDIMWFVKAFSVEMPNDFCCNRYEAKDEQ